ncbi:hydroxylase [Pseudomonas sp. St386]|uniref:Putative oxidoreductase n=2 Tax=Pseudomonas TaxID=286 RepID=F2K8H5_PSEBN|nr:putative oxidoreductase [Pseudomonas brassicacearum subsp. brassicacearum NFM421]ALQ01692.1 putative hydroxylase [Pseudomonas brassicacearum]AOS39327.1 oxidoreductase [Pseudomonas brassicacearum]KIR16475.1 Flavin-dependent monooxygenase, oxygenase subunit HsaA [Pseudomonas fluorescens]BBP51447.1 hydroxylase [Pseudomonas sp. St386]
MTLEMKPPVGGPPSGLPSLGGPSAHQQKFAESPYLSEVGRRMRDEILEMLPLLRQHAAEGEQLGALAPATLEAVDRVGAFKITIPLELGGYALGARDSAEVVKALGQGDASAGWLVIVSSAARNALGFDSKARDEVFASITDWVGPIMFGATVFAPKVGDGRKVDGGYWVKGKWSFGSGCKHAAWGAVGFEYDDGASGERRRAMGILSRDQYTIVDDWNVMGLQATNSNSVRAEQEVFVPDYRVVHTNDLPRLTDELRGKYSGLAFKHSPIGSMVATTCSFAALAVGIAQGALDSFIEQAAKRPPFNLPYKTMSEMASIQVVAAKARAVINGANAVLWRHADEIDRRALAQEEFFPWDEPEITMDLVHQIHECLRVVDGLLLALGSSAVVLSNPLQRAVRDIHVLATHGAFRIDPMAEINGRAMFGLDPFPMIAALSSPASGAGQAQVPPPGRAPSPV